MAARRPTGTKAEPTLTDRRPQRTGIELIDVRRLIAGARRTIRKGQKDCQTLLAGIRVETGDAENGIMPAMGDVRARLQTLLAHVIAIEHQMSVKMQARLASDARAGVIRPVRWAVLERERRARARSIQS